MKWLWKHLLQYFTEPLNLKKKIYHMLVCGWPECALFFRPIEATAEISQETYFPIRLLHKALS